MYRERLAAVDREIRTLAARHPGWLANRANYDRLTSMLEFTFGEQRKDHVILFIRDEGGAVLYRSPHWPAAIDPGKLELSLQTAPNTLNAPPTAPSPPQVQYTGPPWGPGKGGGPGRMGRGLGWGQGASAGLTKAPKFLSAKAGETSWRLGILGNAQVTLVIGINSEEVEGELNHLRNAFLLAFPLALLLVGIGGWVIGNRALRPLKAIADTAEHVTARGLDQRIRVIDSDREVTRVVRVLNGMMDRLEKSFHQATRFTADASHELKTPLAIMQGELENALQRAPAGSNEQQVFNDLLEETQRLKDITRNLLLLAQADSGQLKLSREVVNLSDLLEDAIEDARILASDLQLTFDIKIEPGLTVQGDRILLSTAIHNVLGNALKYNEAHGCIAVQAQSASEQVLILIGNSGPGITEHDQPRLFERFFRGRQSGGQRPDGMGLGLSLAREIIRAHGGAIALEESHVGWTCFKVELKREALR
jgi:signal transduction histidine kinase